MSNHNPIFERLRADSDDIECLVAYALYKKHKRQWAQTFEKDNGGKPSVSDDAAFASAVCTDDQLERYRQSAQDLIIAFANQILEDERPRIEQEAITARVEAAASSVSGSAAFGKQVLSGLVSSMITTFVLIILTISIALFGVDLVDGVEQLRENQLDVVEEPTQSK